MDFIRQAGFWPINPPLGIEEMWPGPITSDGTTHENLDDNLSLGIPCTSFNNAKKFKYKTRNRNKFNQRNH